MLERWLRSAFPDSGAVKMAARHGKPAVRRSCRGGEDLPPEKGGGSEFAVSRVLWRIRPIPGRPGGLIYSAPAGLDWIEISTDGSRRVALCGKYRSPLRSGWIAAFSDDAGVTWRIVKRVPCTNTGMKFSPAGQIWLATEVRLYRFDPEAAYDSLVPMGPLLR